MSKNKYHHIRKNLGKSGTSDAFIFETEMKKCMGLTAKARIDIFYNNKELIVRPVTSEDDKPIIPRIREVLDNGAIELIGWAMTEDERLENLQSKKKISEGINKKIAEKHNQAVFDNLPGTEKSAAYSSAEYPDFESYNKAHGQEIKLTPLTEGLNSDNFKVVQEAFFRLAKSNESLLLPKILPGNISEIIEVLNENLGDLSGELKKKVIEIIYFRGKR